MESTVEAEVRQAVRCGNCNLNQFVREGRDDCRRCGKALTAASETAAEEEAAHPQLEPHPRFISAANRHKQNLWPLSYRTMEKLASLRVAMRVPQSQMAHRMRCPRTYVSKLDNHAQAFRYYPTVAQIRRYAKALDVSLYAILLEVGGDRDLLTAAPDFVAEVALELSRLCAEDREIILDAVKALSKGQMPWPDWQRI
jgi:transcriptional regulator with XRE-family HTH domain